MGRRGEVEVTWRGRDGDVEGRRGEASTLAQVTS